MPRSKKNNAARKAKAAKMKALSDSINRKMDVLERKSSSESESKSEYSKVVQAAPAAFSKTMSFGRNGSNNMRSVKKRELIASIHGSNDFSQTTYSINPGLPSSFPWLHRIAADWQQYRFKSFKAVFVSFVGAGTNGSLILSPEYNISEGAPANEQEALNTQDSIQSNVWHEVICKLDVSAMFALGNRKQVRRNIISADLATYDAALLSVCTVGMSNENRVGSLYFEYEVEFFVPQSSITALQPLEKISVLYPTNQGVTHNSGTTSIYPFALPLSGNPLGVEIDNNGNLILPVGNFRLDWFPLMSTNPGEDYEFVNYISVNNTAYADWTVTGRTDTYGIHVMAPYTVIVGSNGSTVVSFSAKVTDSGGTTYTLSGNGCKVIVTLL